MNFVPAHAASAPLGGSRLAIAPRRHLRSVQAAGAAPSAVTVTGTDTILTELVDWTAARGGWAHSNVCASSKTASGSRGLVATQRIEAGKDYGAGPGVVLKLPFSAYVSSEAASGYLVGKLGPKLEADVRSLSALRRLALLLAAERRLGKSSAWGPYIASLPAEPPNGWALDAAALTAELQRYASLPGAGAAEWGAKVAVAASSVSATAAALAKAFGGPLGNLQADEVQWALGMALSRCFGEEPYMALGPIIDLLNHDAAPTCEVVQVEGGAGDDDGGDRGGVEVRLRVPRLEPGQELTIRYEGGNEPLTSFLNFGFVPM